MPFPIRVSDVMSRPVCTVGADATAATAASECATEDVGSLVVTDDGEPVGIVTHSDLVGLLAGDSDPRARPVREFMSSPITSVESDESVTDAVATMFERDVSRLVVLEDGELAGVVSTDDVLRHAPQVLHRRQFTSTAPEEHPHRTRAETAYEHPDWEFEYASLAEDGISVGDRVTFAKTISEQDVRTFAAASGDTNRLHLDAEFAAETRFGRRIVHGTLVSGLISAALARIPGLTIYISQDLSFLAPVDIGERVTATCEIVDSLGRNKYELTTDVLGEDGDPVIEGEAAVLIDEQPVSEARAAAAGSD